MADDVVRQAGLGGLAAALLIGCAFSAKGWAFEPGDERQIGDLPAYTYLKDGEPELQACAEHDLGDQAGNALLAAGLMPLLSHRHANAVTVMRLQSVAEPTRALAGLTAKAPSCPGAEGGLLQQVQLGSCVNLEVVAQRLHHQHLRRQHDLPLCDVGPAVGAHRG